MRKELGEKIVDFLLTDGSDEHRFRDEKREKKLSMLKKKKEEKLEAARKNFLASSNDGELVEYKAFMNFIKCFAEASDAGIDLKNELLKTDSIEFVSEAIESYKSERNLNKLKEKFLRSFLYLESRINLKNNNLDNQLMYSRIALNMLISCIDRTKELAIDCDYTPYLITEWYKKSYIDLLNMLNRIFAELITIKTPGQVIGEEIKDVYREVKKDELFLISQIGGKETSKLEKTLMKLPKEVRAYDSATIDERIEKCGWDQTIDEILTKAVNIGMDVQCGADTYKSQNGLYSNVLILSMDVLKNIKEELKNSKHYSVQGIIKLIDEALLKLDETLTIHLATSEEDVEELSLDWFIEHAKEYVNEDNDTNIGLDYINIQKLVENGQIELVLYQILSDEEIADAERRVNQSFDINGYIDNVRYRKYAMLRLILFDMAYSKYIHMIKGCSMNYS